MSIICNKEKEYFEAAMIHVMQYENIMSKGALVKDEYAKYGFNNYGLTERGLEKDIADAYKKKYGKDVDMSLVIKGDNQLYKEVLPVALEVLKSITLSKAIEVYRKNFWVIPRLNALLNKQVAISIFDQIVNIGNFGTKNKQEALFKKSINYLLSSGKLRPIKSVLTEAKVTTEFNSCGFGGKRVFYYEDKFISSNILEPFEYMYLNELTADENEILLSQVAIDRIIHHMNNKGDKSHVQRTLTATDGNYAMFSNKPLIKWS